MKCRAAGEKPISFGDANPARSASPWATLIVYFRLPGWKRESTATIKNAPGAYVHTSPPTKQNIVEFDCRGLEFTEFKADVGCERSRIIGLLIHEQGEWMAKGLGSPTKFSSIDLQEGEWFDYDEKAGEEVSIKDLKWEIRRA